MTSPQLLGDYQIKTYRFEKIESALQEFKIKRSSGLSEHTKRQQVSELLAELIKKAPAHTFLLPAVLEYIDAVQGLGLIDYYTFSSFELWLNQYSGLSDHENESLRAKIIGRSIPRSEYQVFFPVGSNKRYHGTHFVTAHTSPDLDTTVASFWGWIDAFGARVSDGLHIWNVPGGPPESQVEIALLFRNFFGRKIFENLAKTRTKLTLCSFDLMTQRGLIRKLPQEPALSLDHERNANAIVVVDKEGFYRGDWRTIDVEGVRQVVTSLENCLRWLEGDMHARLISFFSTASVLQKEFPSFQEHLLNEKMSDSEPGKGLILREQKALQDYLEKVLKVENGFEATFLELSVTMEHEGIADFSPFKEGLAKLNSPRFFDEKGRLIEDRVTLLTHLKRMMKHLSSAFRAIRLYVEQLEVALDIKSVVFGYEPKSLSYRADLEEVRTKMDGYPYLTVNYADLDGKLTPVGVIHALDLQKKPLGTVTLRDFSNHEETKIPAFLEIISVIDHHKMSLETSTPPVIMIADAQSSNTLIAELSFLINDRYSLGGLSKEGIETQLKALNKPHLTRSETRIMRRLLQKRLICEDNGDYGVCPEREYIEYFHYLFAILDDTDLLTKVSYRDVECVAHLLNKLKTLMLKKEVEVIDFDDLPRDSSFAAKAAKKLLQNRDLYSLYSKVYASREEAVNESIRKAVRGEESAFFADTKEQNGCCRVGQAKMFRGNIPFLAKNLREVRSSWLKRALEFSEKEPEFDLHLQMVSTIASADELVKGDDIRYDHKDELWIWIREGELAVEHLRLFLNSFQASPQIAGREIDLEFFGPQAARLERLFEDSFRKAPSKIGKEPYEMNFAVIRYDAGTLNSRKAMISPYLPRLNG